MATNVPYITCLLLQEIVPYCTNIRFSTAKKSLQISHSLLWLPDLPARLHPLRDRLLEHANRASILPYIPIVRSCYGHP